MCAGAFDTILYYWATFSHIAQMRIIKGLKSVTPRGLQKGNNDNLPATSCSSSCKFIPLSSRDDNLSLFKIASILSPEYSVHVSVIKFSKGLMLTLISTQSLWLPKPTLWSNSLRAVADNEEHLCCMCWYLHQICEATLMGKVAGTFLCQIANPGKKQRACFIYGEPLGRS